MSRLLEWKEQIGTPDHYDFPRERKLVKRLSSEECECELYLQSNGIRPDGTVTFQRLVLAFPKQFEGTLPAVAVPFYYPEAALGFEIETGNILSQFANNTTMLDIVRHGYIAASADAYHLTYVEKELRDDSQDFARWEIASEALNAEHPEWSGIGKLVADTKLVIDALEEDPRVDADRIGIAGHSLGGKMAFYTGCLDERVKVILASDFGFCWEQTNWDAPWYWGNKLQTLKEIGLEHTSLLAAAAPKPFCLLAGEADNEESRKRIYSVPGYEAEPSRILVVDHRSGHRPPKYAAEAGYCFLDYWLKTRSLKDVAF